MDWAIAVASGLASGVEFVEAFTIVLAVAVALLMIAGEFDLSIGSMIGMAGMVIAILTSFSHPGMQIGGAGLIVFGLGVGGADGAGEAAQTISSEEQGEADAQRYPTKADLAAVGSVGRTVASLARVELEWRKWREQTREKVERQVGEASKTLSEAANGGGLSSEAEQKIRAALLDIRV